MDEKLEYLSARWRDEGLKLLVSEIDPAKMHNVTTSMVDIYENGPEGKEYFLYLKCEDGKVVAFETGELPAPEAEFIIRGP